MEKGFRHLENLFDQEAGDAVKRTDETPKPHAKHGK
jgi:hypothetical protein